MPIKKAIIPAAGWGTRLLPATKSLPKELFPIVDKPVIQFIVEEAINSGIEDIIIVVSSHKKSIEDYFNQSAELEAFLKRKNKNEYLNIVKKLSDLANINYVYQNEILGLGHAILCAKEFINNEPFAVLLGDDIIKSEVPGLSQLITSYQKLQRPIIGIQKIPEEELHRYGVIDPESKNLKGDLVSVRQLIEKPKMNPPSNLGVIGRYVLDSDIFNFLSRTEFGVNDEIQLTDALNEMAMNKRIYAQIIQGKRYDIGNKFGFVKAVVDFAIEDQEINHNVKRYLQSFE
jgi:UTP--glucose-1-phosphate uridylyltransferase